MTYKKPSAHLIDYVTYKIDICISVLDKKKQEKHDIYSVSGFDERKEISVCFITPEHE